MGLFSSIFGKKSNIKPKEPVQPTELLTKIPATNIPGVFVGGEQGSVSQLPGVGTNVGLYGFSNLNAIYRKAQNGLSSLIPALAGGPTPDDMNYGQSVANMLYNQGRDSINNQLQYDVQRFREDSMRRGMGASSSFLQGINNLMGANSSALADLRNQANNEGLKYAWDLANQRFNTAQFLNNVNKDLYTQLNEIPMNIGVDFAIPQAELWDANKQMNFDRLSDYYTIYNNSIRDYNKATNNYNKNQNDFVTSLSKLGSPMSNPLFNLF